MKIAASTYYKAKTLPPSSRTVRDAETLAEIRRVHQANYGVYGARKVWAQLRRDGHPVARCTVERLMRQAGLTGVVRGKKIRTIIVDTGHERAQDLVQRAFTAQAPNRCWVAGSPAAPKRNPGRAVSVVRAADLSHLALSRVALWTNNVVVM